jgi:predicted nucleic-acid-binding protein
MKSVDPNVLVRLIARDDERQTNAADRFIEKGAWVSILALAETVWVLENVYDFGAPALYTAIDMLSNHVHLTLQDADAVAAANALFRQRSALGFSDCLMLELARKAGHLPLGTFDRGLARMPGAHRL